MYLFQLFGGSQMGGHGKDHPFASHSPKYINARGTLGRTERCYAACTLIASCFVNVAPVQAGWLDDAWREQHASRFGHPAITLNAESGVTLVLPEATIAEARAAELSPREAAVAFLGKYGPEMCSKLIDLNEPRTGLAIKLVIQHDRALTEGAEQTQRSVGDAIAQLEAETGKRRGDPERIFEASSEGEVWAIDYAPTHRARCTMPPDDAIVSMRNAI